MNVGIVTTWFERGAAYVSRAYREILSQEHDVFIYARGGEHYAVGDPRWDREFVTWGKEISGGIPTQVDPNDFFAWVSARKLDVILFNEQISWDIVLQARSLEIPLGTYVDYYTRETVPFFWIYDFLLCNTRRHYEVFRRHPNVLYVPWGTDCDLFRPTEKPSPKDPPVLFHSAGMAGTNYRKGTDILVRAFRAVTPDVRLVIHSQVPLSAYGRTAELIVADQRIEFIEATVAPPGLYHLGDVYVYPTRLEGVGLTIPEALACGLPVITTNSAPMNEFVHEGSTGWLVDVAGTRRREDDYFWPEVICSEAHLAAIMRHCATHSAEVARMGQAARAHAVSALNWRNNAKAVPEFVTRAQFNRNIPRSLNTAAARYARVQIKGPPLADRIRTRARRALAGMFSGAQASVRSR